MTKVTLTNVGTFQNDSSAVAGYAANNAAITEAIENTLSLDGTAPNQMQATFDMNSNSIINLPAPATASSPLRLQDLSSFVDGGTVTNIPLGGTTGQVLTKAGNPDFDIAWESVIGTGTVTSVGLSLPSELTVTGSPITSSGTLTAAWAATPTGTGGVVKQTSPTINTAVLTNPSISTIINGVGTLTVPIAVDTLVARATTDTLSNKTIDTGTGNNLLVNGNAFQATAGTATVTVQNVTDTLVGLQTTDTLTNKTISGSTNTLSNIALTSLVAQANNTIVANVSGGSAAPTAVDISTLASKASPTNADYILVSDQAASGALKKATVGSIATIGSVASFNGRTGAISPEADDYSAISGLSLNNFGFTVSASAGALTINLTDATGATPTATSPACVTFRNPTLTTGTSSTLVLSSSNSVTIPSTSTLGTVSAKALRLWIIGWNDGGTFRLGVFNAAGANNIFPLMESGVGSSTQVVAGGNTAGLHYTAGAAVSSKAFRILGYVDWSASGITTAGTWTTTNLNSITLFGYGIKKPGDVVQSAFLGPITGSSTTSTSFVAVTGATLSLTPTAAVNSIRVTAQADSTVAAGGSGVNSTYVGSLNSSVNGVMATAITGVVSGAGSNLQSQATVMWLGVDSPNSSSSVTYTLNHHTSVTAASATTGQVNMIAEEIMR